MGPRTCPFPNLSQATQGLMWSLSGPAGLHSAFLPAHSRPLSAMGLPQPPPGLPAPCLSSTATNGSAVSVYLLSTSLPVSLSGDFKLLRANPNPCRCAGHPCPATRPCCPSHQCLKPGVWAFPAPYLGTSHSATVTHDHGVWLLVCSSRQAHYRHAH